MRRSTTLAALAASAAVLVIGAGFALAQSDVGLTAGPTGALAAVADSARAAPGSTSATAHVLQTDPRVTRVPTAITVPDLPTTEAAPIERPSGSVPVLSTAPAEPTPTGPVPADTAQATEPAPVQEAAPAPAAANAPVVAPYATVLGWHDEQSGASRTAYLTFDDGPGPSTGRVLDILAAAGVKATFCEIGQRVTENPAITARVAAEGHTLCNHSWDHYSPFDALPPETLDQEIGLTQNAILQAAGVTARYLRAPEGRFGSPGGAVLQAGQRAGTIPLGWGVDSLDWQKPGAPAILSNVMSTVSPGAIILMHDGGGADREQTVAALPVIIASLQAAGYTLAATPPDLAG